MGDSPVDDNLPRIARLLVRLVVLTLGVELGAGEEGVAVEVVLVAGQVGEDVVDRRPAVQLFERILNTLVLLDPLEGQGLERVQE